MSEITNTKSPLNTDAPAVATRISVLDHLRARFVFAKHDYGYDVEARQAGAAHAEVLEIRVQDDERRNPSYRPPMTRFHGVATERTPRSTVELRWSAR